MPPRKDPAKENAKITGLITDYVSDEQPPAWAKKFEEMIGNMETRIVDRIQNLQESMAIQDGWIRDFEEKTEKRCKDIEERMSDAEFHQRKYNLVFLGLTVNQGDCEKRVREFMVSGLEIPEAEAKSMLFAHCHPMPGSAVIVRFVQYRDRERILKSLSKLKGKQYRVTVRTDLPPCDAR